MTNSLRDIGKYKEVYEENVSVMTAQIIDKIIKAKENEDKLNESSSSNNKNIG